jgi:hypothetical protein
MADLLFKMQYHYCMSAIHQTSSRCTAWVRNQDTRVAGSSLAISIGASRAVLNRFLDTSPQLLGQFLMYVLRPKCSPLHQIPPSPFPPDPSANPDSLLKQVLPPRTNNLKYPPVLQHPHEPT